VRFLNLKIHCWGGLGSQLYALAIANALQYKYKNRKIILVLHSSGATQRLSELNFVKNLQFKITQVDDFNGLSYGHLNKSSKYKYFTSRFFIKKILIFTRIICTGNTDLEYKKIRLWTLALRGHYFYRTIEPSFYNFLLQELKSKITILNDPSEIAIHYRMGDLLKLDTKSIYPVEKIIEKVNRVLANGNYTRIAVYSDSPQEAKTVLVSAGLSKDSVVRDMETIDVICECVGAGYFIGTNSKVSLWIVNIRRYLGLGDSSFVESFDSQLYNADYPLAPKH
jgi:hypothetical protein